MAFERRPSPSAVSPTAAHAAASASRVSRLSAATARVRKKASVAPPINNTSSTISRRTTDLVTRMSRTCHRTPFLERDAAHNWFDLKRIWT